MEGTHGQSNQAPGSESLLHPSPYDGAADTGRTELANDEWVFSNGNRGSWEGRGDSSGEAGVDDRSSEGAGDPVADDSRASTLFAERDLAELPEFIAGLAAAAAYVWYCIFPLFLGFFAEFDGSNVIGFYFNAVYALLAGLALFCVYRYWRRKKAIMVFVTAPYSILFSYGY